MFLWTNRPKTTKNRPKSRPTRYLLDLLYKTVLWYFLFDLMLISNGTGHSFIVFFYIKKGDKFFWILLRHVKNLLWNKILALLRSIFGDFFMAKILPKSLGNFSRKNFAQLQKKLPKWQNFAQSGHPEAKCDHNLSI